MNNNNKKTIIASIGIALIISYYFFLKSKLVGIIFPDNFFIFWHIWPLFIVVLLVIFYKLKTIGKPSLIQKTIHLIFQIISILFIVVLEIFYLIIKDIDLDFRL